MGITKEELLLINSIKAKLIESRESKIASKIEHCSSYVNLTFYETLRTYWAFYPKGAFDIIKYLNIWEVQK